MLEHGGDEEQAIAGLLHDAIEDVGAEQEAAIAAKFGPRAAAIMTGLRTLGPAMFDRFNGGQDGTIWYYSALSDVFARLLPGPLATELVSAARDMKRLADIGSA